MIKHGRGDGMNAKNKYPLVFVHGMFGWGSEIGIDKIAPYWGATTGNLMKHLAGCGYECYAASVGPVSSAWDNACELYAQLTGTRVDYGKAHSLKHNHERFGRRYRKPLLEGFGKRKIHLIGHSHGGQVIRLLAHLLTYGDEAEKEVTHEAEISGLFTGGKEDWAASIVSLCTPNNGTSLYDIAEKANIIHPVGRTVDFVMCVVGRTAIHGRWVDYQLEQYGLTPLRGEKKADKIFDAIKKIDSGDDHILADLSFKGAYELNRKIEISPKINYFCYTASGTVGEKYRTKNIKLPPLKPLSMIMARHKLPDDCFGLSFDDSWRENDGLVNTVSGRNPIDEPAKEYDGIVEAGKWNIMPTLTCDHGGAAGLLANKKELHEFYENLAEMLVKTEN